jgi:hypothetical protein
LKRAQVGRGGPRSDQEVTGVWAGCTDGLSSGSLRSGGKGVLILHESIRAEGGGRGAGTDEKVPRLEVAV